MSARVRVLDRGAPGWPERLEHLCDPPDRLWLAGPGRVTAAPIVAVVGSRDPTVVGIGVAHELGAHLAGHGVAVISGMALGVDGAAHRGALDAGGQTVAVLGCGIDVCYPRRHLALRDAIAAAGLIVAEDPPGTAPVAWHFPRRNRIIAALCSAVVVVEASERSGALSTARQALDLGREVLAVPGSIRSDRSRGTNRLIRDGATPLLDPSDLLEALPFVRRCPQGDRDAAAAEVAPIAGAGPSTGPPTPTPPAEPEDAIAGRLLRCIGSDAVHPEQIAAALRLPAPELARRLALLEVAGRVRGLPGGLVVRTS